MRSVAGIGGERAGVEHVRRRGALPPLGEGFPRAVQIAGGENGGVYLDGVAPGGGDGPVVLVEIANAVLKQPGLVECGGFHEEV